MARAMGPGRISGTMTVTVAFPPLDRIEFSQDGGRYYVGVTMRHKATVIDQANDVRDVAVVWSSSDESVASVDRFGVFSATPRASQPVPPPAEALSANSLKVRNPVTAMAVEASQTRAGRDVITSPARIRRGGAGGGRHPRHLRAVSTRRERHADFPPAEVDDQGRFVAYKPGVYTVTASVPGRTAHATVEILPRHVAEEVQLIGHAPVRNVSTSDLWVWEGVDGRDYAITGTHSGHGSTYWWDVTDPASPVLTDSLLVDARTTNDVKVSEDGALCVISREGASNRRNGIVIVDCTDPRNIEIISTYDDELTGGVHNLFIHDDHVYAVNNGIRFDVINIADPANPHRVGRFELDTPGHAIHDIWIVDGIAYTSNWNDGVAVIDVGGDKGRIRPTRSRSRASATSRRTHAAVPVPEPDGQVLLSWRRDRAPASTARGRPQPDSCPATYVSTSRPRES